jgi:fatty acid desaturase
MIESATLGAASLLPRATYVRDLRGELPDRVFARAPSRLGFVPVHLAVIVMSTIAIAWSWVPWFTVPLLSLAIGASFAGLTFIAHEGLHGAIVRGRRAQYLLGFLGFLPFLVSPELWTAWHNSDHHARANLHDDPDAYPTLDRYHAEAGARFAVNAFSLGGSRWRGGLSLILGFTVQSAAKLIGAQRSGILTRAQHRRAKLESGVAVAFWLTIAVLVGFVPFLFVYVLPLLVANVCVMAFILTNHSLSPRVSLNDPLASGLTVTTSRLVNWLTLGFGFHVEHHLFPAMSGRHGRAVSRLLEARWPERYQSMPLSRALLRLHRSGRVYKSDTRLFDPRSGSEHATL